MKSITIIGVVLLALVLAGCDMDNPAGSGDGPGGLALTEVAHYAVAIPEPSDLCFDLTGTFLWTVSDNTRKVYSIELNETRTMIVVLQFKNSGDAQLYYLEVLNQKVLKDYASVSYKHFIISYNNYRKFLKDRDTEKYLKFYREKYQ